MFTALIRVTKSGWLGFWRNRWLSVATVSVVSLTIFGITVLLLINVLIDSLITNLESKIDISVYFKLDTSEEKILETRDDLVQLNEVRSVEYVSTEEALRRFKERHQDNQVLMQSLDELDTNPLEAILNIKAQAASQYEAIANFFNQAHYQELIDKINYLENKAVILRLSSITRNIRQIGFITLLVLASLAVLVTFNTVRLTIYNFRKEIKVMKLVGASNWFIRGPFIIEGALYGITAAIITLIIILPILIYISPKITGYLPGTDLLYFYQTNFFGLFLLQIAIGIVLGTTSSWVAIRRYLDV